MSLSPTRGVSIGELKKKEKEKDKGERSNKSTVNGKSESNENVAARASYLEISLPKLINLRLLASSRAFASSSRRVVEIVRERFLSVFDFDCGSSRVPVRRFPVPQLLARASGNRDGDVTAEQFIG